MIYHWLTIKYLESNYLLWLTFVWHWFSVFLNEEKSYFGFFRFQMLLQRKRINRSSFSFRAGLENIVWSRLLLFTARSTPFCTKSWSLQFGKLIRVEAGNSLEIMGLSNTWKVFTLKLRKRSMLFDCLKKLSIFFIFSLLDLKTWVHFRFLRQSTQVGSEN